MVRNVTELISALSLFISVPLRLLINWDCIFLETEIFVQLSIPTVASLPRLRQAWGKLNLGMLCNARLHFKNVKLSCWFLPLSSTRQLALKVTTATLQATYLYEKRRPMSKISR